MNAQSDQILKLEAEKKAVLAETQARLAQLAAFNQEDLKSKALIKAEENRKKIVFSWE